MRWKKKDILPAGTTKTFRRFAWVPIELHDGYTVWLEHYWITEMYEVIYNDPRLNYWRIIKTSIHHPDKPNTGSTTR